MSLSVMMHGPRLLLVDYDGGADAMRGHESSDLPQRVVGSGCDDDIGHRVAHVHGASFARFVTNDTSPRQLVVPRLAGAHGR